MILKKKVQLEIVFQRIILHKIKYKQITKFLKKKNIFNNNSNKLLKSKHFLNKTLQILLILKEIYLLLFLSLLIKVLKSKIKIAKVL
jgi:hypothetical protein